MQSFHFRFSILGVCLALCAHMLCQAQTHCQAQPNVVLILSDDQAWTDYSFLAQRR